MAEKPLTVVVDANVLISLLIAKGSKHRLLFSDNVNPVSPEWVLFEIGKYWDEIHGKSRIPEEELEMELSAVRTEVESVPLDEVKDFLEEGQEASPDPDDAEYFALALKHGAPIWSEDKEIKRQSRVNVLNTKELIEKLDLA